jgi:aspartate beta-hydroxylase
MTGERAMDEAETERMIAAAGHARQAGNAAEAMRLYQTVLTQAGEHPRALNALGTLLLGQGDAAAAADWFRRAIAADPHAPELWLNLARTARVVADDTGEQAALEGALAIDRRHFLALVRMAELFERQGRSAAAAERWSGVIAVAPMLDQRSPAIEAMLDHARAYVARQHASFADAIEAGLAEARSAVDSSARRRFDAGMDHLLGRRQLYRNECHGLHFPFLPADEFFPRSHFPWFDRLEAHTAGIRGELEALIAADAPDFLPYVSMEPGTPANRWTSLDGKLDWSALHLWKNGVRNDAACQRAPRTTAVVEALPIARIAGRAPTIFFSLLRPGTHLPPHTGVSNIRTIIHLPLVVPEGCTFRVGGETRAWREGEAWAFDDTIEHEAWNRSGQIRAVLIFDVWNPHLTETERELLRAFYPVADRAGYDGRGSGEAI